MRHHRNTWSDLVTVLCIVGVVAVGFILAVIWFEPAHAAVDTHTSAAVERSTGGASIERWHQPYGGCIEAYMHPRSRGAKECRHHGWTVRPRLVVTPHRIVVVDALPHCREEDGSGQRSACTWNIGPGVDGNGHGRMLWVDEHDHFHYVRGYTV